MGRHIHARVLRSEKGCRIRVAHVHTRSDCVHTRDDTVRLNYASRFVRVIYSSHIVSIKLDTVSILNIQSHAYHTAWLKRATQSVCVARTHSIFMPSMMCVLIVCCLRLRSVLLLFLCVVYLFSSFSYLYSNLHSFFHVDSTEGNTRCAFAQ